MGQDKQNDPPDQPIQDFTQCHAGIVRKLDMLAGLPALLEPAARAREIAEQAVEFFRGAIFEHHLDEERELFPAVLANAESGAERERVQALVSRLTEQHRDLEATWKRVEADLKKLLKGRAVEVDVAAIEALSTRYREHANDEETHFLPLAQTILGRNASYMAALGISLHMRHRGFPVKAFV
ncbi:MAG: hemerythrin domain-containing protein [Burkholderiaceae bacterium]